MSDTTSKRTVAVTGATGFFGGQLTKALLDKGFAVHAIIKSSVEEHHQFLWQLKSAGHKLHLYEVDILDDSDETAQALDEALRGCSTVFHCAFRSYWNSFPEADLEKELVQNAIKGTETVMAAATLSTHVQRVVLTSTADAVMGTPRDDQTLPVGHPNFTFTEDEWANADLLREERGPYGYWVAGKLLSEKAALDMAAPSGAPGGGLTVVALCTGLMLGRLIKTADRLTSFQRDQMVPLMTGEAKSVPRGYVNLVHVDDAVRAHIMAMELPEDKVGKGNNRFLCVGEEAEWVKVCNRLRDILPEESGMANKVPRRLEVEPEEAHGTHTYCNDRVRFTCERLLGLGFVFEKTLDDMLRDFSETAVEGNLLPPADASAAKPSAKAAASPPGPGPVDLPVGGEAPST